VEWGGGEKERGVKTFYFRHFDHQPGLSVQGRSLRGKIEIIKATLFLHIDVDLGRRRSTEGEGGKRKKKGGKLRPILSHLLSFDGGGPTRKESYRKGEGYPLISAPHAPQASEQRGKKKGKGKKGKGEKKKSGAPIAGFRSNSFRPVAFLCSVKEGGKGEGRKGEKKTIF